MNESWADIFLHEEHQRFLNMSLVVTIGGEEVWMSGVRLTLGRQSYGVMVDVWHCEQISASMLRSCSSVQRMNIG